MNVSLTPELEKFVQKKVETGRYTSASELFGKFFGCWSTTRKQALASWLNSSGY